MQIASRWIKVNNWTFDNFFWVVKDQESFLMETPTHNLEWQLKTNQQNQQKISDVLSLFWKPDIQFYQREEPVWISNDIYFLWENT